MPDSVSILVVAHQTAANSALLEAVHERAQQGPARFHMVVPRRPHGMHKVVDPNEAGEDEAIADDTATRLKSVLPNITTGVIPQ